MLHSRRAGGEFVGVLEDAHAGAAVGVGGDEPGSAQNGEVLGDRGLGQAQVIGELADAVLAAAQVGQDGQARGVPENGENCCQGGGVVDGGGVVGDVGGQELMNYRPPPMVSVGAEMLSRGVRNRS